MLKNGNREEMLAKWEKGEEAAVRKRASQEAKVAREKAKQEAVRLKIAQAEASKKAKEAALLVEKELDRAIREKARQKAEAAKKAKEMAILAKQQAEKTAKEKARQEAAAAKKAQEAALLARKKAEADAKEKARLQDEAAKKVQEAALLAKKKAEADAKEKARLQDAVAKKVQEAALLAKKKAEEAAKEKARQEAEVAKKAQGAALLAKKETEEAAKEKARQEAEVAKKAQEAALLAKKEAEKTAKEKARQEAEAVKKAQGAAMLAKKEAEEAVKEKARQEAAVAKKAQGAGLLTNKETEQAVKEKARQEAEVAKKAQEAAMLARKESEKAAKEKARQEAEAAKRAQEAAMLARKESEKAAKEKARQEAEATKKAQEAVMLAKKEAEEALKEKSRQEAEAAKKAKEAALLARKEIEEAARKIKDTAILVKIETEKAAKMKAWQEAEAANKAQADSGLALREAEQAIKDMERKEVKTNQDRANQEAMEIVKASAAGPRPKNGHKPEAKMVPLFSRRSIMVLVIGLIVGLGLGITYYLVSPSFISSNKGTSNQQQVGGLAAMLGQIPSSPWTSTTPVQVVSSGTSAMSLTDLVGNASVYAIELQSLPFLNFLKQQIDNQAPQYSTDVNTLKGMIEINNPTQTNHGVPVTVPTLNIKVTATTIEETKFLADFVPKTFQSYLTTNANQIAQQQIQDTLDQIDQVKAAAAAAGKQLDAIKQQFAGSNIGNTPDQVALTAQIGALELQVNTQASQLVTLIAAGSSDSAVTKQLQALGSTPQQQEQALRDSLADAQNQLRAMDLQSANNNITNDPTYVMLNAEITALQGQLATQADAMASIIATGDPLGQTSITTQQALSKISAALTDAQKQLANLQAQAITSQQAAGKDYLAVKAKIADLNAKLAIVLQQEGYQDAQAKFAATSAALAKARQTQALATASGTSSLDTNVDYQVAKAKVDSLNNQLAVLNQQLGTSMVNSTATPTIAASLAVENASVPLPVMPARAKAKTALALGTIIGLGGAWVLLNRRWVTKGLAAQPQEDDEDNA